MVRPYGMDLRERVVAAVEAGESRRSAARRYGVSESVAVKWLQRVAATGSVKPGKMGGYRRPALEGERDWLLARIAEKADVTVRGLSAELAERGVKASPYAVWSFFRREGLTFKKSQHAAEQDRPDVARKRARWKRYQNRLDPGRLVFVDETWAKTNMTRTHGRAACGQRLVAKVPHVRTAIDTARLKLGENRFQTIPRVVST